MCRCAGEACGVTVLSRSSAALQCLIHVDRIEPVDKKGGPGDTVVWASVAQTGLSAPWGGSTTADEQRVTRRSRVVDSDEQVQQWAVPTNQRTRRRGSR